MRDVLNLFKLRIGVAIAIAALAGLAVERGAALAGWQIAVLALAVLVSSAAAGAFNQYVECDIDRRMARTRNRPFVTGRLPHHPAWLWLIGAMIAAAVLAGAAAVSPVPGPEAIALAVVLFLCTPPHFWSLAIACRDDYAAAGVPMLPVVVGDARAARAIFAGATLLVAASLVPVAFGLGWIYLAAALSGGAWFLLKCRTLLERPDRETARASFRASLVQLSAVLIGAMLDAAL